MDDSTHLIIGHVSRRELRQLFSKITVSSTLFWKATPCWIWTAYIAKSGYGQINWKGKITRSHRVMYAWLIAPVPFGPPSQNGKLPEIDHLCRNRSCCNPVHLDLVSRVVNMERSPLTRTKLTTHCVNGHEFTFKNTRQAGPTKQNRACIQCQQERNAARTLKEQTIPEFKERRKRYASKRRQSPEYKAKFAAYMKERRRKGMDTVANREREQYKTDPVFRAAYNARKRAERKRRRERQSL
jgi:hypothetical protein